jgi:two-component system phosphate regulon sensor histidine kinase PhoR
VSQDETTLSGKLDSKIKLDVALFFGGNPDAIDSAASLGTWAGYREAEMEEALQELCRDGLLVQSGSVYRLTSDPEMRQMLGRFLGQYEQARQSVEDVIDGLERDRERMAERIEELEISTQAIVKSMGEGIVVVDPELRLRFANRAAADILGDALVHGLGEPITELVEEGALLEALRESKDFTGEGRREIETIGPHGQRYYLIHANAITTEEGDVYGHICVLSDITELRELDNLKSDLISFVSHELRNPLGAVKSYADTLVIHSERLDEEKRREFAEVISQEVDRLARLIDGFLDISRIEAGRGLDLVLREFDAVALARRAVEIQSAAGDECPLSLEAPDEEIPMVADRDKILQVLLNLLSNAVKYSPEGGEVTLSVARPDNEVQFTVIDQGLGIDSNQMAQIFTPFYRVRRSETRSVRGTGLGLYLSRHLVEAHGGRLWVESEPGQGSRFYVALPERSAENGDTSR